MTDFFQALECAIDFIYLKKIYQLVSFRFLFCLFFRVVKNKKSFVVMSNNVNVNVNKYWWYQVQIQIQ